MPLAFLAANLFAHTYDSAELAVGAEAMKPELEELLALNEAATLAKRHAHFRVPGTTPDDFRESIFELSWGKLFLAGIRHLNANRERPFVQFHLGFSPSAEELETLKLFAKTLFARFSPEQIALCLNPRLPHARNLEARGFSARRYFVGKLAELRAGIAPPGLELHSLSELDADWYQAAYRDFHARDAALADWVPATDLEELDACAKESLLFEVRVRGARAGLIAGTRSDLLGIPAIYVTELLLAQEFKGQGWAAPMQKEFCRRLPAEAQLLWGTIDAKNAASTATALKVGRKCVRSEFFLPLS